MFIKMLIFAICDACKASTKDGDAHDTMDQVWAIIVWSLVACWLGYHPKQRWDGAAWPAGSAEAILAERSLEPHEHGTNPTNKI